eukprot:Phypoly_transcript_11505.p1 GENE.Phypoly_transcript_11505~~Phypoly_transcript_11505.p1  ORF type:complete len:358 (+),score=61.01 Phypoly_transcript_11505:126-1199(+)
MSNGKEKEVIDLRSDTVTHPTEEMRKAMFEADVGDDVYGEDVTVNKLQQLAANMFGKENALFVPSGTMGNLLAILSHARGGEEIILGDSSHIYLNEQGGAASLAGIIPRVVKTESDGTLPLDVVKRYIRGTDVHHAQTRIVALENTHNFCGGRVLPTSYVDSIGDFAHSYAGSQGGLKLHMDGARIFNASVHLHEPVSSMVKNVDSISVCLSKGLAAPVGSVLVGSNEFIAKARRWRKAVGGGMRQAGVIAAAGIVSLTTMVDRLAEDHENAKLIAESIKDIPALNVWPVETNIIIAEIKNGDSTSSNRLRDILKQKGVLISSIDTNTFRITTHYQISKKDAQRVATLVHEAFNEMK